jgi:hypothetical protein
VELDTNADGWLTRQEFLAAPHRLPDPEIEFDSRDADHDGLLPEGEFCAGAGAYDMDAPRARINAPSAEHASNAMMRPAYGMNSNRIAAGMMTCAREFTSLDLDQDGQVTRDEYAESFDRRDGDHDGILIQAEMCLNRAVGVAPRQAPDLNAVARKP